MAQVVRRTQRLQPSASSLLRSIRELQLVAEKRSSSRGPQLLAKHKCHEISHQILQVPLGTTTPQQHRVIRLPQIRSNTSTRLITPVVSQLITSVRKRCLLWTASSAFKITSDRRGTGLIAKSRADPAQPTL